MTILVPLFVVTNLLLIGLAIPMAMGKVKPNWLYGFRVPKTVNNPDIWYPANAYAGKALAIAGGVTLAASVILALVPGVSLDVYSLGVLAVLIVALGLGIGMSFVYLSKL